MSRVELELTGFGEFEGVELLQKLHLFQKLTFDETTRLGSIIEYLDVPAGTIVIEQNALGDALYVIVEGEMQARREGEVVLTMKAKESFGETSLFDGAPRINEVVAVQDSKVLVIDRRDFLDLLADRPELLSGMFRVLSRQLKSMVVEVTARKTTTNELQAIAGPPVPE